MGLARPLPAAQVRSRSGSAGGIVGIAERGAVKCWWGARPYREWRASSAKRKSGWGGDGRTNDRIQVSVLGRMGHGSGPVKRQGRKGGYQTITRRLSTLVLGLPGASLLKRESPSTPEGFRELYVPRGPLPPDAGGPVIPIDVFVPTTFPPTTLAPAATTTTLPSGCPWGASFNQSVASPIAKCPDSAMGCGANDCPTAAP